MFSEFTVEIKTESLIEKLKENREEHQRLYAEAVIGYVAQVQDELEKVQDQITDVLNDPDNLFTAKIPNFGGVTVLPKPEDHTEDYNRIIEMLEHHDNPTVTLPEDMFRQYAQDDWGWKKQWTASVSNYTTV